MTSLFGRVRDAIRRDGFIYVVRETIPHLHKHYVRKHLPRTRTRLNGVIVRSNRLFDNIVPWQLGHPDPEEYESAIVSKLRSHVRAGDEVVIVGGGWGVSTVVAAEESGAEGSVTTYEASPKFAKYTEETVRLNDVADRCTVKTAIVSHAVSTKGETETETVVSPTGLPACDVMELDCEGAELEILRNINIRPKKIIVETHGDFGAPTDDVAGELERLSYDIVSREIADIGLQEMHEENDIRVLTAIYDGD